MAYGGEGGLVRARRSPGVGSRLLARARFLAVASGALALVLLVLPVHRSGRALAIGSFTATADARLVGQDAATDPPVAFSPLLDAGASVAQSQIDALGNNLAFASTPYPGATVIDLPSLVAGITSGATSFVPPYPLIASASPTATNVRKTLGTIVLDATSAPASAGGSVTDGLTSAVATTSYEAGADQVTARAESSVSSLQLTGFVGLAGVHTTAQASAGADGKVSTSSSFAIASLDILGHPVAVTSKGLQVAGTAVPLGVDPSALLGSLLAQLAAHGTTVQFVPAVASSDGVSAAGLIITTKVAVPQQFASGVSQVTVRTTLGFDSASVAATTEGQTAPTAGGGSGAASAGTNGGAPPSLSGGGQPQEPGTNPALTTSPEVPASAGLPAASQALPGARTSALLPVGVSVDGIYPVLFVAGLLGFALFRLFSNLGVRQP